MTGNTAFTDSSCRAWEPGLLDKTTYEQSPVGSTRQVVAALADALSVDDATPKCAGRVQFSHARGGLGWSECQAQVYLSA